MGSLTYPVTVIYPNGITQGLHLPNRPINNTSFVDKLTGDVWCRVFYRDTVGWWPLSSDMREGFIMTLSNRLRSRDLLAAFEGAALRHEFLTITNDTGDLLCGPSL